MAYRRSEDNGVFSSRWLPLYSRWWFAPILMAIACMFTAIWFVLESIYFPADDYWFYLRGYSSIGAASGFASWYFARLVAKQHVSVTTLACFAAPGYLCVVWLALEKNSLVAALATVVFGFVLSMSLLAQRSAGKRDPA